MPVETSEDSVKLKLIFYFYLHFAYQNLKCYVLHGLKKNIEIDKVTVPHYIH